MTLWNKAWCVDITTGIVFISSLDSLLSLSGLNKCAIYTANAIIGYVYPIVKMDFKYISPAFFGDELRITSTIINYDGLLKIAYEIYNTTTNKLCAKSSTSQAAVMIDGFQTMFTLNREFLAKIEVYLENS